MPRIRRGTEPLRRPTAGDLVDRLADELRQDRPSGQPVIDEQVFPTDRNTIRVVRNVPAVCV